MSFERSSGDFSKKGYPRVLQQAAGSFLDFSCSRSFQALVGESSQKKEALLFDARRQAICPAEISTVLSKVALFLFCFSSQKGAVEGCFQIR